MSPGCRSPAVVCRKKSLWTASKPCLVRANGFRAPTPSFVHVLALVSPDVQCHRTAFCNPGCTGSGFRSSCRPTRRFPSRPQACRASPPTATGKRPTAAPVCSTASRPAPWRCPAAPGPASPRAWRRSSKPPRTPRCGCRPQRLPSTAHVDPRILVTPPNTCVLRFPLVVVVVVVVARMRTITAHGLVFREGWFRRTRSRAAAVVA